MIEQSEAAGDRLHWSFHAAGTGTALPGLIAAKLLTNHPVRFRSIAICAYDEGGSMSPSVIVNRVKLIMKRLGVDLPPDHRIRAEIDVDQRFIDEDYAVPTLESVAAIRELAQAEGVFIGPVYTGKGFAGMLDHVRAGRVERGRRRNPPRNPRSCRQRCRRLKSPTDTTWPQSEYSTTYSTAHVACTAST